MKGYLKDQLSFILFYYSQVLLIILVAQLYAMNVNQPMNGGTLLYLLILPSCFLIVYLLIRYRTFRTYYTEDIERNKEHAWLPEPPNELLRRLKNHYEKQYESYQTELEQHDVRKNRELTFIQQWVHQMKTPISVMNLTLQKDRASLPNATLESMSEELDKLERGLELVLYQSRLQQFDRDFHVEKYVLRDLVTEHIQEFKSSFIRNHTYPDVHIPEHLVVYTDQKWISFVLNQITANAIKYASHSNTKIRYEAQQDGSELYLSIIDEGVGIPKQDLPRIFDPFFTGQNGRTFRESTGMGLFLAKEVCDALGHLIQVTSEVEKGTRVMLTFRNLTTL
ncbi:sensor histidine kinase [Radiobacillus deserti]|uniref:histidine kinase n=1 Tax=Radiobacillus deserti TaxID=2594883 RepID=A0A516KDD5_9BACI|nr:sensor histidine kinase [Radiobacillus deserti]QDP39421.1 HAMP domain-containing histidine kinase [Radiobacillus deserti]